MSNQEPSRDRFESKTGTPGPQDMGELVSPRPIDQASALRVEIIEGKHIRVQVTLEGQDASLRIKEVCFEAIDSSGRRIATYRTIDPIHIMTSRSVLAHMKFADNLKLNAAGKAMLIHDRLTRSSTVRFETIPEPPALVQGRTSDRPIVYRIIPRLDQFIRDPRIIDEQFGGHWTNGDTVTRISALLKPKAGFVLVTVKAEDAAEGQAWDWSGKFLAPADPAMNANEVRRFLLGQAHQAFARVCTEGLEGLVAHLEDSDSADCQIIETDPTDRAQLDKRILAGDVSGIRCIEKHLESGAIASLVMGQTSAAISVAVDSSDPTIRVTMIYSGSNQHEQLTSWQIHYIREAYEKLTSNDPDEQREGILRALSIQKLFPETSPNGEPLTINSDAQSYKTLEIKVVETGHTLAKFFGEELVGRVEYLPGIKYGLVSPDSEQALRESIQGRRRIVVQSAGNNLHALREHPEHFREMKFFVSNDQSLYIIAKNGIGSRLTTKISTVSCFGYGVQATIAHLIQLFANQSKQSWSTLLATIDQLKETADQSFCQNGDLVAVNDFPPSEDVESVELFEKAANMYSWLLTEYEDTFPRASLRYTADGGVELELESFHGSPGFRFCLRKGIIRQLTILRRAPDWTETRPKHEVCAVFNSETLAIESDEARKILEGCSTVQHDNKNHFLDDDESKLQEGLRMLLETIQQSMTMSKPGSPPR